MSDISSLPSNRSSPGSSGCEAIWLSDPPHCRRQCGERLAWKRDVALEISVDVERIPVTVRFAGTLDTGTAVNLVALLMELIDEGHIDFELQASELCVPDESGMEALTDLQHQLRKAGGNLAWDGLTLNHPFPAEPPRTGLFGRQGDGTRIVREFGPTVNGA